LKALRIVFFTIAVVAISACATNPQPQTMAVQSNPGPTPNLNAEFLNFANQNPEIVKQNILITCKTAYPELNISDVETGEITGYVVDQNPMTINFEPKVEISMNDTYFVDIQNSTFIVKDRNKNIVSDQNIITLVIAEMTKITLNGTRFLASITLEKVNGAILTKSATCTFTE